MKNYFIIDTLTITFATLSWFVPFFVSVFLVDPQTKATIIDPILFKSLMIIIVAGVTLYGYNTINTKSGISIQTANTFLGLNVLLDAIVLMGLFSIPFIVWVATILPVYILVFYGVYFMVKRRGIH